MAQVSNEEEGILNRAPVNLVAVAPCCNEPSSLPPARQPWEQAFTWVTPFLVTISFIRMRFIAR
jgi:hypothetical protein